MKHPLFLIILIVIICPQIFAQLSNQNLSLEECYEILYRENPVTDKIQLSRQITGLNQKIAASGWYPDVQINASASYQSDVVEFPFDAPAFDIPEFSHDHYNLSLNITQPIFDGGRTRSARELEGNSGEVTEASLESDLLSLKEQLDRIYFGILILQKQKQTAELVLEDLNDQHRTVKSQVENGVLLPGNAISLRAEILKREQELVKTESDIAAGYEALSELLNREITPDQYLQLPSKENWENNQQTDLRPELSLLNARETLFDTQKILSNAGRLPTVSLFAIPSYGRPGLNFFEDDLQFNWIVGVRARWNLTNTRNASIKTEILDLEMKKLAEDTELFQRKQNTTLRRLELEIKSIENQIEQDREILDLREQVAEEKRNQLERGAITSTEYVQELNAQSRAQLQLELRKILRIQAITNYETEQGWIWN